MKKPVRKKRTAWKKLYLELLGQFNTLTNQVASLAATNERVFLENTVLRDLVNMRFTADLPSVENIINAYTNIKRGRGPAQLSGKEQVW